MTLYHRSKITRRYQKRWRNYSHKSVPPRVYASAKLRTTARTDVHPHCESKTPHVLRRTHNQIKKHGRTCTQSSTVGLQNVRKFYNENYEKNSLQRRGINDGVPVILKSPALFIFDARTREFNSCIFKTLENFRFLSVQCLYRKFCSASFSAVEKCSITAREIESATMRLYFS